MTPPPAPKVGGRLYARDGVLHHVRAIVDAEDDGSYQVVMRWWSPRKGWRYVVESSTAFEVGLYRPRKK